MRYSRYLREDPELMRRQTTLQHSYVVTLMGSLLCQLLRPHGAQINEGLLMTSLLVHDHGEGELAQERGGVDVIYINKSESTDLDEYQAFVRRFRQLDPRAFDHFHRAYLLDFARNGKLNTLLPADARQIMLELNDQEHHTILGFYAVERWDYMLHAVEHYVTFKHGKLLVQVMRNQVPHLDLIAQGLPGFKEEIWTPELQQWCTELLAEYEGQYIERKG